MRIRTRLLAAIMAIGVAATVLAACEAGAPPATPPVRPGTAASPREVSIIAKDWVFLPDPVDFAPGETVLVHVVNGGLDVHEVVIGDAAIQDAWETAEAAVADHPPGPTPLVSVAPDRGGIRIVVTSGQRVDLTWTVPPAPEASRFIVGCHIPGHWAKGMRAEIRLVPAAG